MSQKKKCNPTLGPPQKIIYTITQRWVQHKNKMYYNPTLGPPQKIIYTITQRWVQHKNKMYYNPMLGPPQKIYYIIVRTQRWFQCNKITCSKNPTLGCIKTYNNIGSTTTYVNIPVNWNIAHVHKEDSAYNCQSIRIGNKLIILPPRDN